MVACERWSQPEVQFFMVLHTVAKLGRKSLENEYLALLAACSVCQDNLFRSFSRVSLVLA